MKRVLLVGNPNCGKTTLFNALTGENQRVGNWAGVTVEKKSGTFQYQGHELTITDLPGIYSLVATAQGSSQDEQITSRAVVEEVADVIIHVIDACHLERHLYLTSQLLELGKPLIIVLNMMDIAACRGIEINAALLSEQLQCSVVMIQAHKHIGLDELKETILNPKTNGRPILIFLPERAKQVWQEIETSLVLHGAKEVMIPYLTYRILEGDTLFVQHEHHEPELDMVMADARYNAVHQIAVKAQKKRSDASDHMTAKLDKIVLHRYFAFPLFLCVMYGLFLFAMNVGGAFQDFFDITTDALFVKGMASLMQSYHMPNWLIGLCAHGIGKGINTTLTFIPVIASMYFFLSLLEASGYMARAAFIVDKVMRLLGLPGKAFVPMIVGFGCNVPAIMAARTLDSEQDRLITILMSPFMSCSARLAIYAIFVAAFFPTGGQNIVFSLYLIGILMAVLTGVLLRRTLFRAKTSPLIIELPAYHVPSFRRLMKETMFRLRYFLVRAGKLIIPVCVVLGGLNTLTLHGGLNTLDANGDSVLSLMGQWLTPIFSPMGLHSSNWPATVGLLTGMLAKEVVVGSLNALYEQMGHLANPSLIHFHLLASLKDAFLTIPHNLAQLVHAFLSPLSLNLSNGLSQSVYGIMYQQFDGKIGAYAYMLFILLYIPCVSTMAAIRQEASRRLMWFSILWSLIVAYSASVLFYQIATYARHPLSSMGWILGMSTLVFVSVLLIRRAAQMHQGASYAVSPA